MKDSRLKRNIEGVILGILLLIPCFSVLGRVLYTQWNQNAKDSYYNERLNSYNLLDVDNISQVDTWSTYYIDTSDRLINSTFNYYITDFEFVSTGALNETQIAKYSYTNYRFNGGTDYTQWYGIDENGTQTYLNYFNNSQTFSFMFRFSTKPTLDAFTLKAVIFDNYSYLDNAFDYSIYKIVDTYGVGNINFLNWFGNLMFNNPNTLLYCQFANLYLNYCLYINVGYLIYYFFTFFIRMIRKLLDSFIDRRF